ncbi:hypothetical protein BH20ACI2_BH20ACI2_04800 [soil metagenome]
MMDDFSSEECFVSLPRNFFLLILCFLSTFAVNAQIGIVDQDAKTKPPLLFWELIIWELPVIMS